MRGKCSFLSRPPAQRAVKGVAGFRLGGNHGLIPMNTDKDECGGSFVAKRFSFLRLQRVEDSEVLDFV